MAGIRQRTKYAVFALYSLSMALPLTSCSTTSKNIFEKVYDSGASVLDGVSDSIPGVNKLKSNIKGSYSKRVEQRILDVQEQIDDKHFEDVAENRDEFVGVIKDMSRFILAKSAGDPEKNIARRNIQYIIPDMEEEFMNSKAAASYGGRKKDAVKVLIESFKIMSYYFSEEASQAFFRRASYNSTLCKHFHILREKDDGITRKKAMMDNAKMIGFTMYVSPDIMDKERELHMLMKGQRVLNYLSKENE